MQSYNLFKIMLSGRGTFLCAGFAIAAWAPMIPYVQQRFDLDEQGLGLMLLCVAGGGLAFMPLSSYLTTRLGCKKVLYATIAILSLCLGAIPLINNIYVMALLLIIFGGASVAADVVSNINAALLEKILDKPIMSGLHGMYSVGGFLGASAVTAVLGFTKDSMYGGIFAAIALAIMLLTLCPHLLGLEDNKLAKNDESRDGKTHRGFYIHHMVLIIGILCFIMFLTEGAILDWSSVYLHQMRNVALENAGYGYAAFAIAMTLFRLSGDKIVSSLGRRFTIVSGSLCVFAGFATTVIMPSVIGVMTGFFLIGVGASNIVPQLISYIAKRKEMPMHISITYVNALGYIGILSGPALIGFIAQRIGLEMTFLCLGINVLILGLVSFVILRTDKSQGS